MARAARGKNADAKKTAPPAARKKTTQQATSRTPPVPTDTAAPVEPEATEASGQPAVASPDPEPTGASTEISTTLISVLAPGLLAFSATLPFVGGWAYAYEYFVKLFNIGILSLQIPAEYYYIYGFWVLRDAWPSILWPPALFYAALFALWRLYRRVFLPRTPPRAPRHLWLGALPPALIAVFALTYGAGGEVARRHYALHAQESFPNYPSARVRLAKNHNLPPALTGDLARGCYQLVLENAGKLFFIYAFKEPVHRPTLALPAKVVESVEILPGRQVICD